MSGLNKIKGVYVRKDGRCQARYKKGVGEDNKPIYGVVYGKTIEEAIEKRRAIVGDEPEENRPATELNLLILGAGSHGKDVKEIAESIHIFRRIAFLDDQKEGEDILGKCRDALRFRSEFPCAFVAVGDNKKRQKLAKFLRESNFLLPSIVSPFATISGQAKIGEGVAIFPQATVGEAEIGDCCILASNSLVNRDARLEAFVHVDCGGIVPRGNVVPEWTYVGIGQVQGKKNGVG